MCKTMQPLLMTKTGIIIMGQNKNESLQLQGDFWMLHGSLVIQLEMLRHEEYKHWKMKLAVIS